MREVLVSRVILGRVFCADPSEPWETMDIGQQNASPILKIDEMKAIVDRAQERRGGEEAPPFMVYGRWILEEVVGSNPDGLEAALVVDSRGRAGGVHSVDPGVLEAEPDGWVDIVHHVDDSVLNPSYIIC